MNHSELNFYIHNLAKDCGFDQIAILAAVPLTEEIGVFKRWLATGSAADMNYLTRNVDKREDPRLLVEGAKTVIVTLVAYPNTANPATEIRARYSRIEDYHLRIKRMLRSLYDGIATQMPQLAGRVFVDTAPVMERSWAVRGGLGWIGRNSLLVNKELGSYFNIGVLIIDQYVEPDIPIVQQQLCGGCTNCVDICPTAAISADRSIDARNCIAYHTTQNKGEIPAKIREVMGERIFGCDICQEVCPFN